MAYSEDWIKEMDEEEFWLLIKIARKDERSFLELIDKKDRRWLIRFVWFYEKLSSVFGREKYIKHTNSDFSEDVLDDLWRENVGKGKDYYEDILKNPEKMPNNVNYEDPAHKITYNVFNTYHREFGEEIPPNSYDY